MALSLGSNGLILHFMVFMFSNVSCYEDNNFACEVDAEKSIRNWFVACFNYMMNVSVEFMLFIINRWMMVLIFRMSNDEKNHEINMGPL